MGRCASPLFSFSLSFPSRFSDVFGHFVFPYHHLPMGIAILVGTLGTARSLNCLPFLILFKTSISPPPAQILVLSPSLLWAFSLPHSSFFLFRTSHHQCLFPINQFLVPPHPFQSPSIFLENCVESFPHLDVVQSFSPTVTLLPDVCPLCLAAVESTSHLIHALLAAKKGPD